MFFLANAHVLGYIKMHILSSTHVTPTANQKPRSPCSSAPLIYRLPGCPGASSFRFSIQRRGERDTGEAHVAAAALEELEGAPEQGLLGEDVLVGGEGAAGDGTLAAAVELPEGTIAAVVAVGLDEADVVQVDVVAGVGGGGLALAGGLVVGGREGRGLL